MLNKLNRATRTCFVDHPGLNSPELRAINHIGYKMWQHDRQGVVDTWTNEKIKKLIQQKGIQLIGTKIY
jgi:hypothetical protein